MMKAVVRRLVSLMALSGMTLVCVGGCCCVPPPPPCDPEEDDDCEAIDIAFVFPRDGFTLNVADDADGDTSNGIQVDPPVRVAYSGNVTDGGAPTLTLTSDQGELAEAPVDEDGFARFSAFTVFGAAGGMPVALTVTDGDVEDEIEVDVVLEDPDPDPQPDPDPDPLDDGGLPDASATDAGWDDGGAMEGGAMDGGAMDGEAMDGGTIDGGAVDAGVHDAEDAGALSLDGG